MVVTITTNIKSLQNVLRNVTRNIKRSQTMIARKLGKVAMLNAKASAPVWRGDLKRSIVSKTTRKRSEVFIKGNFIAQSKAYQNEYGLRAPVVLLRSNSPMLDEWATDKGYFHPLNSDWVVVGGKGTRLGRANVFWRPAFDKMLSQVPSIAEQVITKAILHTRG